MYVTAARLGPCINSIDMSVGYHYVVVFVRAEAEGEPMNGEPDKCEGWTWAPWPLAGMQPLFLPLQELVDSGFNPFS
jgi:8-oxo-dGTP diphosphatase